MQGIKFLVTNENSGLFTGPLFFIIYKIIFGNRTNKYSNKEIFFPSPSISIAPGILKPAEVHGVGGGEKVSIVVHWNNCGVPVFFIL